MNMILKFSKGTFFAFSFFLILNLLLSLILFFSNISANNSFLYQIVILSLSTLMLGLYMGKNAGKKGLLVGVASGLNFVFVVLFCIFVAFSKEPNIEFLTPMYLLPILLGGIGGIIGVNVKK